MKTFIIGDIHGRRAQLHALLQMLPRDEASDMLVFLGDLIDRGADAPGVVADVIELQSKNPERVICLRGNHEQMMLDFIDEGAPLWLTPVIGSDRTYEQYTGRTLLVTKDGDFDEVRNQIMSSVPPEHLEFFRRTPFYHEDDYALYVHAGLVQGQHPRDTHPRVLLWTRDPEFFKNYRGKPCVFGHTPTPFLPLLGRLGRHGIYISHSAIGLDTGYNLHSPLSCLCLPDFHLYQTFADGHTATHHITKFIPETLRAMRKSENNNKT
ncbi:MAG TPA: metallophosphoesterase family protein [Pyrinomonadaceae bacterium]|nr:metallophosphoesterase family protein [Pyrinomonadaceae bacterium]